MPVSERSLSVREITVSNSRCAPAARDALRGAPHPGGWLPASSGALGSGVATEPIGLTGEDGDDAEERVADLTADVESSSYTPPPTFSEFPVLFSALYLYPLPFLPSWLLFLLQPCDNER